MEVLTRRLDPTAYLKEMETLRKDMNVMYILETRQIQIFDASMFFLRVGGGGSDSHQ